MSIVQVEAEPAVTGHDGQLEGEEALTSAASRWNSSASRLGQPTHSPEGRPRPSGAGRRISQCVTQQVVEPHRRSGQAPAGALAYPGHPHRVVVVDPHRGHCPGRRTRKRARTRSSRCTHEPRSCASRYPAAVYYCEVRSSRCRTAAETRRRRRSDARDRAGGLLGDQPGPVQGGRGDAAEIDRAELADVQDQVRLASGRRDRWLRPGRPAAGRSAGRSGPAAGRPPRSAGPTSAAYRRASAQRGTSTIRAYVPSPQLGADRPRIGDQEPQRLVDRCVVASGSARTRSRLSTNRHSAAYAGPVGRVEAFDDDLAPYRPDLSLTRKISYPSGWPSAAKCRANRYADAAVPPRFGIVQPDLPPGVVAVQRTGPVGQPARPAAASPPGRKASRSTSPTDPSPNSTWAAKLSGRVSPGAGEPVAASRRSRTGRRSTASEAHSSATGSTPAGGDVLQLVGHHLPQQPAAPIGRMHRHQGDRRDRHRAAGHGSWSGCTPRRWRSSGRPR